MSEIEDGPCGVSLDSIQPGGLRLRTYPDTILRMKAAPVEEFDGNLQSVIREMVKLMRAHDGIGLAAPQVGISQRIIVAAIGSAPVALVNPEILHSSGEEAMVEGCLSLPGVRVNVLRKKGVTVKGVISNDREVELSLSGLMARVLQHEIDHLNGVLISDCDSASKVGTELR